MKKTALLLFTLLLMACEKPSSVQSVDDVTLYDELHRPQYHFTPSSNWMNDPNGMVYYQGEYHLFYQYYPDSNVWGPMHWGHAVSTDMMSWEHLPIALYPDSLGYIFSGSAVIDWANTSGFGTLDNPPMVAIFTYHHDRMAQEGSDRFQYQGIAYSLDKGRSWAKYEGNPVLANPGIIDFRDPKVFWHEATSRWTMILAMKDRVGIYSSADLKVWDFESDFGANHGGHGGVWECPDLFQLEVPNEPAKWVMLVSINPGGPQGGSATQYFIGDFDGKSFTAMDTITRWVDLGADNYAGVTWSDIPKQDGRRLFMGWMSNWNYAQTVPTTIWRSAMTLPRELYLKRIGQTLLLQSKPASEIAKYLSPMAVATNGATFNLESSLAYMQFTEIGDLPLEIEIGNTAGEKVVLKVDESTIVFERSASGQIDFESGFGNAQSFNNFMGEVSNVGIFLDRSSVEIFINDGEFTMTQLVFPSVPYNGVRIVSGNASLKASKVASIWGNE